MSLLRHGGHRALHMGDTIHFLTFRRSGALRGHVVFCVVIKKVDQKKNVLQGGAPTHG